MKQAATSASRVPRVCLALATAFLLFSLVSPLSAAHALSGQLGADGGFSVLSTSAGVLGTSASSAVGVQTAEDIPQTTSVAVPRASMVFELRGSSSPYEYPTFTFTLKAEKASYPMPSEASGSSMSRTLEGAGALDFGSIEFSKPGVYSYKIVQAAGKDRDWRYDTTVFHLKVVVTKGDDGLLARESLTRGSSEEAVDSVLFTNVYDPDSAQAASKLPSPEESFVGSAEDVNAAVAPAQGTESAQGTDAAEKTGDAAGEEQAAGTGAVDADADADGDAGTGADAAGDEDADTGEDAGGDADADRSQDVAAGGQDRVQDAQGDAGQEPAMRPAADTLDPVEAPAVKQGLEPGAENPTLTAAVVAAAVVVVAIGGTAGMTWVRTRRDSAHG